MSDATRFSTASADGTALHGQHWVADAPVAVMALVHGFGEHCGRYAPMAEHLNANGISVVALDLHGHGQTPGPRGVISSYDDFRADLAALLAKTRALYPTQPMVLYGHSMGGGIVLDHGFDPHPDIRAIIASAPLIALPDPIPGFVRGFAKLMGRVLPSGGLPQPIVGEKVSTLPAEQALYEQDPLNHGRLGFRTAVGIVEAGEAIAAQAGDWGMPLLLLHSRADVLTSYAASEAFAAAAKRVEFHSFDCAHEMHNDTPRAEIFARMTEFILQKTQNEQSA